MTSKTKARHRTGSFWFGLLISLGCLVWAVQALDWPQVGRILTQIAWSQAIWLVVGVGAIFLSTLTRAWRWGALFYPDRLPFRCLLTAMLVGQTLNYFAPARAGDLARAYWLGDRTHTPPARALGTIVVEKLWDLLVVLVSLALLPLWLDLPEWLALPARGLTLLSLSLLLGILFSILCRTQALQLVERFAGRLPAGWDQRVGRQVVALIDGLESLRRGGAIWRMFLSTLAVWIWGGVAHLTVFWALDMSASLTLLILLSVVLRAGVAAPSLPASIGIYEGIIIACLAVFDVSAEVAFSYGVLMHAVDFGPPILFTVVLVWTERRRICPPHSVLESSP
jgi:uncharacterized protein (TIRG00374 family)